MPGNEVGDRVHNFLGQESVQQGQHNSQVFDGTWPGLNNSLWVGSQRQVAGSLVSNFKNYSSQQLAIAESERGHVVQSPSLQHGLNFMQSALRPDISRAQSQNLSAVANGYMQGHQAFQTRQNEANFLGMDTASRGISVIDSHMANSSELVRRNSLRLESSESPVNYDFFGSPQSMGVQNPGMLHHLPRQQSGIADIQLLQQRAMLKQMQEFQRQELKPEFQQHETMHIGSINQASSFPKHGGADLSHVPINGIPIHDALNHSWQPELMTGNTNWMQHGASSAMQVASSGLVSSPDPGHTRLMGFVPQQVGQSLYGVPVNSSRGNPNPYAVSNDKLSMQPIATSTSFLSSNQYATYTDQFSLPEGNSLPRQSEHGKNMFGAVAAQGLHSGANSENLRPLNIQSRNFLMHESFGRLGFSAQPEISQERSEVKANPSQNVATLDPTEKKILFGSDDNIWDIFGKGGNMGAMLDGGDSLGAFPSVQSGSWSALMQSAVAESSSSDMGPNEQCSGLSLDNGYPLARNTVSLVAEDGYRKQTTWTDNILPTSSQMVPSSNDTNMNLNHCNAARIPSTGIPASHVEKLRQHDDPAKRDIQGTPERQYDLLNNSNLQKLGSGSSRLLENVSCSPDVQLDARSVPGQLQCTAFGSGSQIFKNANGWNFIDPASNDRNSVLNDHSSESSSHFSGVGNHQTQQIGRGSGVWKPESLPDARMPLGNFQSVMEKSQVSNEGSNLNNVATEMDSVFVRTQVGTQELQRSHNLDLWRDADFPKSSGPGNTLDKERKKHDKVPQMVDLPASNRQVNLTNESCELVNSNNKENSNDSFRSNVSHNDTAGMGESELLDGSDRRGMKLKASEHAAKKPSVTRKFQYHPMGDLDVDVGAPYKAKHVMHSQSMQQHVSQGLEGYDHRTFGQSKFHGGAFGGYKQIDKDCAPGFQSDLKCSEQSESTKPDHAPVVSAPMSGNMSELLQNVDQSGHPSHASHFSSSGQQNQPYASQGFNLQLAPPSERSPISDRVQSQSLSQPANVSVKNVDSEMGKKGDAWFGEFKNDDRGLQQNNEGDLSNTFSSRTPYQGRNIQEQHVSSLNGQVMQNELSSAPGGLASEMKLSDGPREIAQTDQSRKLPGLHFSGAPNSDHAYKSQRGFVQQSQGGLAGQEFPVLEAMTASQSSIRPINPQQVAFSKMLPRTWTNISAPQKLSGAFPPNDSQSILKPPSQLKADDQNDSTTSALSVKAQCSVRDMQPETVKQVSPSSENDVGHNSICASQSLCRDSDQETTQRDIAAFGRSLRPNNSANQNYSLLHQMQAMRASEADHQNRSMKRFKVADTGLDAQHAAMQGGEQSSFRSNAVVRDAMPSQTSVSAGNCKLVLPSSNRRDDADSPASFQEKSTFVGNSSANLSSGNFATALRVERPQISPQMAPSWFDQYGTFKNGQMFPSENTQKTSDLKSAEKPSMVVMPTESSQALNSAEHINAAGDTAKLGNLQQSSSPVSIASEHISSPYLGSEITDQNLNLRQKKRKGTMPGLLPWHREVTVGLQKLQMIGVAEVDWAHAANRLTEKVEDQAQCAEDRQPALRSKRRVVLTTQLMQKLFQAPSRVLSANSREHCESIAYFTARLALGDACSSISTGERDNVGSPESGNMSCEKVKSSVRIGDQYISKVVEDCVSRTKMIEMEILRLDKRASILDLRLECQDVERFSVINRFARFHGRGQGDGNGVETPSSSDTGIGGQKPLPQRYVAALPMPKNIPDRVQCLSL